MTSPLLDEMPPVVITGNMREAWTTREREVLVEGPAGSGKTFIDCLLDHTLAMSHPRSRFIWSRATLVSLRQSILVTFEEHVLRGQRHPCMHGRASRQTRTSYRYPNGSEILLLGLNDPENTFSMEVTKFTVYEAVQTTLSAYEKLLRLLRWPHGPYRQGRLETNPREETHWINKRPDKIKSNGKPQIQRIKTTHRDNPFFWDYERDCLNEMGREYVDESLAGMSGARRANLLDGVWCAAQGQIWPEYDHTMHLIERAYVPELSTYIASMDFGFNAPGCVQVWGGDGSGKWYRVAEVYRTGANINQWADWVAELWSEYRFRVGIADCAEPGSIQVLNTRLGKMEGRESGAVFIPANKSKGKQHGLNQVRAAMDPLQTGGPRFFLVKDALRHKDERLAGEGKPYCTELEIPGYTFLEPDETKPIRETPDPAKPNEGCDAAEYFWTWIHGKYLDREGTNPIKPGSAADVLGWRTKRRPRS